MNKTFDVLSGERIVFMDRARFVLVALVVFMHSACAYTNIIPWWSVQENPKSVVLDIFVIFADGFQMPVLFFISGFFAYYSVKKRSRSEFIISKFRRLGWPFLAVLLFLTPYISYIGIQRLLPEFHGFFRFWIFQIKTVFDFTPVFFSNMEVAIKHWMDYSSWHLWFVLLLLLFYFIYVAFDYFKNRIASCSPLKNNDNIITAFIIAGFLMAFCYSLMFLYIIDWPWFKLSIFSFQPVRLPLYIGLFILGIYSASRSWFIKKELPGSILIWGILSLVFSGLVISCMIHLFANWYYPRSFSFSLFHGFARAGVIISMLGFIFKAASADLKVNRLIEHASPYAYEIYIVHLPVVIFIAKLFTVTAIPVLFKFFIISTAVSVISLVSARYLFKPYPKTAAVVITVIFLLLCSLNR
jgi:fucose 4-O-acetylase-like acetyltransferase